ncbi:MAG: hypothetical protein KAJ51_04045 [Thermoplasmata archaeon]|nr:hypothetical protein [Thermoplasmata archaeon]
MKKILILVWMGVLILGLFTTVLLNSGCYLDDNGAELATPAGATNLNTRGTRSDPWYINTTRIFASDSGDQVLDMDIIIYETGSLTIKDITITMDQSQNYQYKIQIKDSGKLILDNGILRSNFDFAIYVQDFGKLELKKGSLLNITKLEIKGNSKVVIQNSKIENSDLTVYQYEFSSLEMKQLSEIKCKTFSGEGSSSIKLDNSNIIAKTFIINCSKVEILNNNNVNNFEVISCLDFTISKSTVQDLKVANCRLVSFVGDTNVKNSLIDVATDIIIEDSKATNLTINYCTSELLLSRADIENLEALECSAVSITNNTNVRSSHISKCKSLTILGIYLDSLDVDHCENSVSIIRSTINHLKVTAPYTSMVESDIACNEEELDLLTQSSTFYAINSSFNLPLNFKGDTIANLVNIDTNDKTPEINVSGDAIANIYWWLTINVIDNESNPLVGVEVKVHEFFTDEVVNSSVTNNDGIIRFALLGNVIKEDGQQHSQNKSYVYRGVYQDYKAEDLRNTRMDTNRNRELLFGETLTPPKKDDEDDELSLEGYIGIIIIIILVILVIITLASRGGGSKKNSGNSSGGDTGRVGGRPSGGYRPPPRGRRY